MLCKWKERERRGGEREEGVFNNVTACAHMCLCLCLCPHVSVTVCACTRYQKNNGAGRETDRQTDRQTGRDRELLVTQIL